MHTRLVIDCFAEVYEFLKPYLHDEFWELSSHQPLPHSVYVIGRQQVQNNLDKVKSMCNDPQLKIVFCNVAEGGQTQKLHLQKFGLLDLVIDGKLLLLTGADFDIKPTFAHDHFLERVMTYEHNQQQCKHSGKIFEKTNKPYKFLFLNGRMRPHRKFLLERLRQIDLLDQGLWTMLDSGTVVNSEFSLWNNDINLLRQSHSVCSLPPEYEVSRYEKNTIRSHNGFAKHRLFNNEWGEIYIDHRPYVDTYFSLVTETTVVDKPFRTEKIAKPLAIGHPWIAVAPPNFYRDLKNLGFQTFGHLIDESFDSIENTQDRLQKIISVVQDLCRSDLVSFLAAAQSVCKYNQQHLNVYVDSIRQQFSRRFFQYINE